MDYEVGMKVVMKKGHPCGTNQWEIVRVGMDFKIRCLGCQRVVMLPRKKFEKNLKHLID